MLQNDQIVENTTDKNNEESTDKLQLLLEGITNIINDDCLLLMMNAPATIVDLMTDPNDDLLLMIFTII